MNDHPRCKDNMYVARAIQAERDRKTAEAHEYYRQLVRARTRRPAEATVLAESPASPDAPADPTALTRYNARKHGLCAETLGVEPEENEVFDNLLEELRAEYRPAGPTEELLVRDLWRHACFLHICARAESGYIRHCYARTSHWAEYKGEKLPEPGLTISEVVGNDRFPVIASPPIVLAAPSGPIQKRLPFELPYP